LERERQQYLRWLFKGLCQNGTGAVLPGAGKGGGLMMLSEMSIFYADSANAIRLRIAELREEAKRQTDAERARALRRRIVVLTPLLREMRELAALTEHYYDRSYHKHERYTL
jgi:hypothetical protein